jgi:hypothetical protein
MVVASWSVIADDMTEHEHAAGQLEIRFSLRCSASCQVPAPRRPFFLGVLAGRDQA